VILIYKRFLFFLSIDVEYKSFNSYIKSVKFSYKNVCIYLYAYKKVDIMVFYFLSLYTFYFSVMEYSKLI